MTHIMRSCMSVGQSIHWTVGHTNLKNFCQSSKSSIHYRNLSSFIHKQDSLMKKKTFIYKKWCFREDASLSYLAFWLSFSFLFISGYKSASHHLGARKHWKNDAIVSSYAMGVLTGSVSSFFRETQGLNFPNEESYPFHPNLSQKPEKNKQTPQ